MITLVPAEHFFFHCVCHFLHSIITHFLTSKCVSTKLASEEISIYLLIEE